MLGSLARWLRAAGLDVLYQSDIEDAELVERAAADGRVILTRDRRLVARRMAGNHLLITSDRIDQQLLQVMTELGLEGAIKPFGRCLDCNTPLVSLSADAARTRVPPYVAGSQSRFRYCSTCDRIFWRATHVAAMEARLRELGIAGSGQVEEAPEAARPHPDGVD